MSKLAFSQISHRFGDLTAVDGLSLSVATGEIVCLLGPSGCGKTTSLRLAAGLEEVQAGRIEIDGRLVAEPGRAVPPEGRRIGMVFQDYALFPHLNVAQNVGFGLQQLSAADRSRKVSETLTRVGLSRHADSFPHQLSGGEQQRVALARALAPEPGLMLMDEPFANLDVTLRNAVRDETLALLKAHEASVLLVTHDPEEAMRMADRVAVMQSGRLVQLGRPDDIYFHPVNSFMARFFGPVNEFAGTVKHGVAHTPLGDYPAVRVDGPYQVLVRPEALTIDPTGDTCLITDVRLIGAYWRVMLQGADGSELRARTTAVPPRPGSAVSVTIDPDRMILFPAGA